MFPISQPTSFTPDVEQDIDINFSLKAKVVDADGSFSINVYFQDKMQFFLEREILCCDEKGKIMNVTSFCKAHNCETKDLMSEISTIAFVLNKKMEVRPVLTPTISAIKT